MLPAICNTGKKATDVANTALSHLGWTTPTHCWVARRPATSTDCRWHLIYTCQSCMLGITFCQHPLNYDGSSTVRQQIAYKLAVITYCIRSTGTTVYLTDRIKNYHPSRTLRSADKLLLSVPRLTLALSAKAFSVSVWNSLSYNCRSAESFSSFRRALKTELFDTAYSEHKHSA